MSSTLLPVRIESTQNLREHWAKRARRTKAHRNAALLVPKHALPCIVTLTRIGRRYLDDDNNVAGFKALRDGIAARLGVDDADRRVRWFYKQEIGKQYAVRVEIA